MNKRGAELSMNVIIVAILALLVLVIVAIIFTMRLQSFRISSEMCETQRGSCMTSCDKETSTQIKYSCDNDKDGKLNEPGVDGVCCIST